MSNGTERPALKVQRSAFAILRPQFFLPSPRFIRYLTDRSVYRPSEFVVRDPTPPVFDSFRRIHASSDA